MRKKLLILLGVELTYLAVSRTFTHSYEGGEVSKELIWTAFRAISLIVTYLIFRRVISNDSKVQYPKTVVVAGSAFLLVPLLVGSWGLYYPLNLTYAATSLIIGIREEFVYRGVLQNIFEKRFGICAALLLSNVCFVAMHWGSLPFTAFNTFQFATAGTILGLIYYRTRSIWLVAALHFIYDAIWSLTPILPSRLPIEFGYIFLAGICVMLVISSVSAKRPTNTSC